jgi:hypothetical protein
MAPRPKLHLEKFLPYRLSVFVHTVQFRAIAAAYFMNFGLSIPRMALMAVLAAIPACRPPRLPRAPPWTRSP